MVLIQKCDYTYHVNSILGLGVYFYHIPTIGYELSQAWKSSIERTLVYSADKKGLGFFVGHNTSNQDPDLIWHTLGISKRGGKSIDPIYDTYYHLLP